MATIVAKELRSATGVRVFEFTNHVHELGLIAGHPNRSWRVWIRGPEEPIDTKYEVVFAATNDNQRDRLNFRASLNLTKTQKASSRLDKTLRTLFGIPRQLEFAGARVMISPIPRYRRVVLTMKRMTWKIQRSALKDSPSRDQK